MGFIWSLIIGGIIGWLAGMILGRDVPGGVIGNIIAGFIGAWIGSLLGGWGPVIGRILHLTSTPRCHCLCTHSKPSPRMIRRNA